MTAVTSVNQNNEETTAKKVGRMRGAVEEVNELRAVFFVRCVDGTYAYLRVAPGTLPKVGDVLSWPDGLPPHGGTVINETEGDKAFRAASAIPHLPRDVAQALCR
jgi:hypothetical protein